MVHVEHHAADPDRDHDRPHRRRSASTQRPAHDGQRRASAAPARRPSRRGHVRMEMTSRRGHQRRGGPRTVGGGLGGLGDQTAQLDADHQEQRRPQVAPRQGNDDHNQGDQPEDGRPEHGAEHIPERDPAGMSDSVAMRESSHDESMSSASATATHSRSTSARTPRAPGPPTRSARLPRCHLTAVPPVSPSKLRGAVGLLHMAVFLRKLLRIGGLPDELRAEVEAEGIIHLAEYVSVTRRFSGRSPASGRRQHLELRRLAGDDPSARAGDAVVGAEVGGPHH